MALSFLYFLRDPSISCLKLLQGQTRYLGESQALSTVAKAHLFWRAHARELMNHQQRWSESAKKRQRNGEASFLIGEKVLVKDYMASSLQQKFEEGTVSSYSSDRKVTVAMNNGSTRQVNVQDLKSLRDALEPVDCRFTCTRVSNNNQTRYNLRSRTSNT